MSDLLMRGRVLRILAPAAVATTIKTIAPAYAWVGPPSGTPGETVSGGVSDLAIRKAPFDMTVLNDLDRFHLVIDIVERAPPLAPRSAQIRQAMGGLVYPRSNEFWKWNFEMKRGTVDVSQLPIPRIARPLGGGIP